MVGEKKTNKKKTREDTKKIQLMSF